MSAGRLRRYTGGYHKPHVDDLDQLSADGGGGGGNHIGQHRYGCWGQGVGRGSNSGVASCGSITLLTCIRSCDLEQ